MSSTQLHEPFNTDTEEGSKWELIPNGTYPAEIIEGSTDITKNGAGHVAKLKWQITEGEYERRQVFQTVVLQHTESEKAEKIGRGMFKDICFACGITGVISDLNDLFYKTCAITVRTESDPNGRYSDRNKVSRVNRVGAMATPAQRQQAANQAETKAALHEASKVQPGFKKVDEPLNDEVPW